MDSALISGDPFENYDVWYRNVILSELEVKIQDISSHIASHPEDPKLRESLFTLNLLKEISFLYEMVLFERAMNETLEERIHNLEETIDILVQKIDDLNINFSKLIKLK